MMKRLWALLALLVPVWAAAQDVDTDFGGRVSVGVNYKIAKGLHLKLEEELRLDNNFGSLDRLQTTVGLSYKLNSYVRFGAGYTLINPYKASASAFNAPRHRLYGDVTGSLRWGDVQFQLRERLQFTHRGGSFNTFQTTPNALALKSRFTVKYKGWKAVEPSLAFELRTALNEPWGSVSGAVQYKDDGTAYYAYTSAGYTHAYNNRYRGILGLEWKLTKQLTLEPYVLLDYVSDYVIDTNSEGTKLFSAGYENTFRTSVGIGFTYSF